MLICVSQSQLSFCLSADWYHMLLIQN